MSAASGSGPVAGSSSSQKHSNLGGGMKRTELRAFVSKAQEELLHAANTHISQLAVLHETAVERIRSTAATQINELRAAAGMPPFTAADAKSRTSAGGPKASGGNRKRVTEPSNRLSDDVSAAATAPPTKAGGKKRSRSASPVAPPPLPVPVPCATLPDLYTLPKGTFPSREAIAQGAATLLLQGGLTLSLLDEGALAVLADDLDVTMPPAGITARVPSDAAAVKAAVQADALLPWAQDAIGYNARLKQHFVRTPLHPNDLPASWLPMARGASPPVQDVVEFLRLKYFSARSGKAHEGWWLQFPIGTREYSVRVHLGRQRGDSAAATAAAQAAPGPHKPAGKSKRFIVTSAARSGAAAGRDNPSKYAPTWLGWLLIADGMERRSLGDATARAVHFVLTPGALQWLPLMGGGRGGGSKSKPLLLPFWPTGHPPSRPERQLLDGTAASLGNDAAPELPVGSTVLCNWLNTGLMWSGRVASANADGSYHVAWTDGSGEHEWSVPRHRLELESAGGTLPAGDAAASSAPPSRGSRGGKARAVTMSAAAVAAPEASITATATATTTIAAAVASSSAPHGGSAVDAAASSTASQAAMSLHSTAVGGAKTSEEGGAAWTLDGSRLGSALWTGEPVAGGGQGMWMAGVGEGK